MNGEITVIIIHSFSECKISDPALPCTVVLHMRVACKSHLCVGIGGKYVCVMLHSRIAPNS